MPRFYTSVLRAVNLPITALPIAAGHEVSSGDPPHDGRMRGELPEAPFPTTETRPFLRLSRSRKHEH